MPNYRHCMNCHGDKDQSRYGEYLCQQCADTAKEAEGHAKEQNLDIGATRKAALAARAPHSMAGKHPAMPFDRINSDAFAERLQHEANNPRTPIMYKVSI